MSTFKYNAYQVNLDSIGTPDIYPGDVSNIVGKFTLDKFFKVDKHRIELNILSLEGTTLQIIPVYDSLLYTPQENSQGLNTLTIDPASDAPTYGYDAGDVILVYKFFNNLFTDSQTQKGELFIESISGDRKECRLLSTKISSEDIVRYVNQIKANLESGPYFYDFKLNLGNGEYITGLNIDIQDIDKGQAVIIRTYEPLPDFISVNKQVTVEEEIADPVAFSVYATLEEEEIPTVQIKGANFQTNLSDYYDLDTEYLNYDDLLSYETSNPYYELRSYADRKGASLSIDYGEPSEYIHFSSAAERLKNFKYKLELLERYSSYYNTEQSGSFSTTYQNLIDGLLKNFDGYEMFLYYESGSNAWPKQNTTKPFYNYPTTSSNAQQWYTSQLAVLESYDEQNPNLLVKSIPRFIREDSKNEPYVVFVNMIGHHFDNIWSYAKGISKRYSGDNRLNYGIPKDLVRHAVESLGVKLYNSPGAMDNLFASFSGEVFPSGSEQINTYITATEGTSNAYLQPMPKVDYQRELYKRIYHNIPLLLKTKGTERGIKTLLNCYGIPSEILQIVQHGGTKKEGEKYISPTMNVTSSLDKIRINNTGSIIEGSTLSTSTSAVAKSQIYSDDLHTLDIGFNISKLTDQVLETNLSPTFNIDDYIGDPRNRYEDSYSELKSLIDSTETENYTRGIVRLLKYFDTSVFKMVKDFIPARSSVSTGVIIKSPQLVRSKAKQPKISAEENQYQGSIEIGNIEGSDSGAIKGSTIHTTYVQSTSGVVLKTINDESPKFNGELSGSEIQGNIKELNSNNEFKHYTPTQIPPYSEYNVLQNNVEDSRVSTISIQDNVLNIFAPIQDQLRSDIGLYNARYGGSKTSSDGVNHTTGLVGTFGNNAPVESKKNYFGYISEIEDPYPLVNNVTYLKVKYLIDGDKKVQKPSLSANAFSDLKGTFTDLENVDIKLSIPRTEPQLINLNGDQDILHVGKKATPVLYSQTSSLGYASSIPLLYSLDNLTLQPANQTLINLAAKVEGSLDIPTNFSGEIESRTYFTASRSYEDSRVEVGSISDVFKYYGEQSTGFYSSIIQTPTSSIGYYPYYTLYREYNIAVNNFNDNTKPSGVAGFIRLDCWNGRVDTTPMPNPGPSPFYPTITATVTVYTTSFTHPDYGSTYDVKGVFGPIITGTNTINLNRNYLKGFLQYRFGGDSTRFNEISHFVIKVRATHKLNFNRNFEEGIHISGSTGVIFNPSSLPISLPSSSISLKSPAIFPEIPSVAGRYWEYVPSTLNSIYLMSGMASLTYGSGYSQDQLEYNSDSSSRFSNKVEPEGLHFPKTRLPWSLLPGDEIRFENNESYNYKILSVTPTYTGISSETPVVMVTVDRDIPTTVNKDIFVIRRYVEGKENIIINKTFPYSNPITVISDAPSTTGYILPKYPVDIIKNNPDQIIKDLIDKKIIE